MPPPNNGNPHPFVEPENPEHQHHQDNNDHQLEAQNEGWLAWENANDMVQDDQQSGVSNASMNNFMFRAPGPEQVILLQPQEPQQPHQPDMMLVDNQPQQMLMP